MSESKYKIGDILHFFHDSDIISLEVETIQIEATEEDGINVLYIGTRAGGESSARYIMNETQVFQTAADCARVAKDLLKGEIEYLDDCEDRRNKQEEINELEAELAS